MTTKTDAYISGVMNRLHGAEIRSSLLIITNRLQRILDRAKQTPAQLAAQYVFEDVPVCGHKNAVFQSNGFTVYCPSCNRHYERPSQMSPEYFMELLKRYPAELL